MLFSILYMGALHPRIPIIYINAHPWILPVSSESKFAYDKVAKTQQQTSKCFPLGFFCFKPLLWRT